MNFIPKDYVSVATRVEQYHADHKTDMSIDTVFTLQWEVACFRAVIKTSKGTFTGSSFGRLGKEKAFEKLETVAVGRALAFAGYEVKEGIASKEEMDEFNDNNTHWTNDTPNKAVSTGNTILKQATGFIDVINAIKVENDSNVIDTLVSEARWTEKQISWAKQEADKRKQVLKSMPKGVTAPVNTPPMPNKMESSVKIEDVPF